MTEKTRHSQERLNRISASYPGIVIPSGSDKGSHIHAGSDGQNVLVMSFRDGDDGHCAELLVSFILTRVLVGKQDEMLCDCYDIGSVASRCTDKQLEDFLRFLDYGSSRSMQSVSMPAIDDTDPLPLSVLLSHALTAFFRDYGEPEEGISSLPPLAVFLNFLRCFGREGIQQKSLGRQAVLSVRALKVTVQKAEAQGWLVTEKGEKRGDKILRLTQEGCLARDAGAERMQLVLRIWRTRFGNLPVDELHRALASIASRFDIEWPYCLTGYGNADLSVTGGTYIPEQPGPPRTPAHGQDWPVVLRERRSVDDLSLPALLSQVLAAFTIDYERENFGSLAIASRFFQGFDPEGTLQQLAAMAVSNSSVKSWVDGTGKPLLERHLMLVVEPGKKSDKNRRIYLTPKGRHMRDVYPAAVRQVEGIWAARYGTDDLVKLRASLEALDRRFEAGLPEYPNNTQWLTRWTNLSQLL